MATYFKLIQNTHPLKKQFLIVTIRLLNCCTIRYDEDEFVNDGKPKGKISVIKRKFYGDDESDILEWKFAADVMKRLNWENQCLFGPIQPSNKRDSNKPVSNKRYSTRDLEKVFETNRIIQHETQIPIIDPVIQNENSEGKCAQISRNAQLSDLNSLMTFPLENKLNPSTNLINEANLLRKHLESLSKDSIPSVSSILQKTMPKERVKILERWKLNMIKQLGEEGFQRYHTALLNNGSALHDNISSFLASTPESELVIKEENIGHWNSLKKVLPHIKDVKLLEEFVTHPFLCYRGVVDCYAKYRDNLVVIDWKTSKKDKTNIKDVYDNPLQIAAYVGALNFDPKFQYLAMRGLIVVAYESGSPATVHFIDKVAMKHYWNEWLKRVKEFWEMESERTENV